MRPDDAVRIRHMIEAAEACERFVAGRRRVDLDGDLMLLFGWSGFAATRLPIAFCGGASNIP
jgi:hypothetical protein